MARLNPLELSLDPFPVIRCAFAAPRKRSLIHKGRPTGSAAPVNRLERLELGTFLSGSYQKPKAESCHVRLYPPNNRPNCSQVPRIEGAYVVVTHSGITLVPILGGCLAQEIVENGSASLLIS